MAITNPITNFSENLTESLDFHLELVDFNPLAKVLRPLSSGNCGNAAACGCATGGCGTNGCGCS